MSKQMLTVQHSEQKVAYLEFNSENDETAKTQGEFIFKNYSNEGIFVPKFPNITGNFTGYKPKIISHHVSKWIANVMSTNAWGMSCGGYWSNVK